MIAGALLAAPGIAALAVGTPRQAQALSNGRLGERRRRLLRFAGIVLLAASLLLALGDDDRARHLVGWIGTVGFEALVATLLFTLRAARPAKHLKDGH